MATYTAKAGQHPFTPPVSFNVGRGWKRIGWKCQFHASCVYDHAGPDQDDWNKLAGVSFHLFDNHRNSVMFGWRWNETLKVFDLNTYAHIAGERFMGGPALAVPPGNVFYVWLEIDYAAGYVRLSFQTGDFTRVEFVNFPEIPRWNREIGSWFGGNLPAPHEMKIEKTKVWAWEQRDGIHWPDKEVM